MSSNIQDQQAMEDFKKAREIANECGSLDDISALTAKALLADQDLYRPLCWAIMFASLILDDRLYYLMLYQQEPEIARQFTRQFTEIFSVQQAHGQAQPQFVTTPVESMRCFLLAIKIGKHAKSKQELLASVPQDATNEVKIKTMVWASIYYSMMRASPTSYNLIKNQYPDLVGEFEQLCELVLIEIESDEPGRGHLTLSDFRDFGFNIDNDAVDTMREFRRLTRNKNLIWH
jgi:hypothetical protein